MRHNFNVINACFVKLFYNPFAARASTFADKVGFEGLNCFCRSIYSVVTYAAPQIANCILFVLRMHSMAKLLDFLSHLITAYLHLVLTMV